VPDAVKWGSFSVEKGFVPPMGMMALYSYLKSKGVETLFIDTQFGGFDEARIKQFLAADPGIGL